MTPIHEIAARVLELDAKATPGPWDYDLNHTVAVVEPDREWGESICRIFGVASNHKHDAKVIAHYRTAAPALAHAVLALHAEKAALEARLTESERLAAQLRKGRQSNWSPDLEALCAFLL